MKLNPFESSHLLFSIFALLISISPGSAQTFMDDYDVVSYDIAIEFFPSAERLQGEVWVVGKSLRSNLARIHIDLHEKMQIDSVEGPVHLYVHQDHKIEVHFQPAIEENELFEIRIHYHGQPPTDGHFHPVLFSHRRGSQPVETISTESCPYYAHYWWPCKDTPADKPDSVQLHITIPNNLEVAANGIFMGMDTHENDTRTHHWHIKNPIATYLITLQITDYAQFSEKYESPGGKSMDLMYFIFPEDSAKAIPHFRKVSRMLDALTYCFGEYPYLNEKYGMAEYIGEWAAMEYQTLSCFSRDFIADSMTILHELAHQWFGDCVTPTSFHHSWVSEGFATYTEALYKEAMEGEEIYHDYMNHENNAENYHDTIYRYDISTPGQVYPGIVYYKGAWVLHMLRHWMGDSLFFKAVQNYFNRFAYASATTEDLQQVFEETSGLNLGEFFQQWIYEVGYPHYFYDWSVKALSTGQYHLTGFIDQKQEKGPVVFKMPVDLGIKFAEGDTLIVQEVDEQGEKLDFVFDTKPMDLQIDPNGWILKTVSRAETPEIEFLEYIVYDSTGNLNDRPDPGETVDLWVKIQNTGIPLADAGCRLTTTDQNVTLLLDSVQLKQLDHRVVWTNQSQPFRIKINPTTKGHLGHFNLVFSGNDNFSQTLAFGVKIGKAPVLFVDDDQGQLYEQFIETALDEAEIYANRWDIQNQGSVIPKIKEYQTLIWLTGDSRDSTLTPAEQVALQNYLAEGGQLLLSGQNIGFDLVAAGSRSDSLFYSQVLNATYQGDHSGAIAVMSSSQIAGLAGIQLFFQAGEAGAKNQTSMDIIEPVEPAKTFLKYIPGNQCAGIFHHNPVNQSKIIYLPFGIEGIAGPLPTSSSLFLRNLMGWFAGSTEIPEFQLYEPLPEVFDISQNYPNPFNPQTAIEYQVPEFSQVKLEVINLLGQKVQTLVDETKNAGYYKIHWDGRNKFGENVASGVYWMHFQAGNYSEFKKMMLVR